VTLMVTSVLFTLPYSSGSFLSFFDTGSMPA
jgi:hypothetical protein